MKEYEITFKYSDVLRTVEADNEEDARAQADKLLESGGVVEDTFCYEIEVEEVEQ